MARINRWLLIWLKTTGLIKYGADEASLIPMGNVHKEKTCLTIRSPGLSQCSLPRRKTASDQLAFDGAPVLTVRSFSTLPAFTKISAWPPSAMSSITFSPNGVPA